MTHEGDTSRLLRRLALTIAVPVAYLLAQRIPAVGIDATTAEKLVGGVRNLNVFSMGIMPALSAYVLVEMVAASFPRTWHIRHSPAVRKKLDRAVGIAIPVLAIFQGFGITTYVRDINSATRSDFLAGDGAPWLFWITITAAVCVVTLGARLITFQGIANGFVLLYVADGATDLVGYLWRVLGAPGAGEPWARLAMSSALRQELAGEDGPLSPLALVVIFASIGIAAFATAIALGQRADDLTERIPVPSSSLYPFSAGPALLALPYSFAVLGVPGCRGIVAWLAQPTTRFGTLLVIALAGSYAMATVLNRPERVAAVVDQLIGAAGGTPDVTRENVRTELRRSLVPTALFLAVLVLAEAAIERVSVGADVQVVLMVSLMTAVLIDGIRSAVSHRATGDLVCVWEERRPYAVSAIRAALAALGVKSHVHQVSQLALFRPFGAFVPVRIMTASADAPRAVAELERLLTQEPVTEPVQPERVPSTPGHRLPTDPRTVGFALMAALAGALLLFAGTLPSAKETAGAPSAPFEVALVDDTVNPFSGVDPDRLPDGITIGSERTAAGPHKEVTASFAEVVRLQNETWEQARDRLAAWTSALRLPDGTWFAFGERSLAEDDVHVARSTVRTFVVRGRAIVNERDVESAKAMLDAERKGGAYVSVRLRGSAGEKFRQFTYDNRKRRLAIVVGDKVESAPVIQSEIAGGYIHITLGTGVEDEMKEARRLARALGGQ
jgi:hypothetical protein